MRHNSIALALSFALLILGGCSGVPLERAAPAAAGTGFEAHGDGGSSAPTLNTYKRELANHIVQANAVQTFAGRPQALLRSVVVVKYAVDARGHLLRSEIMRSNHDRATEAAALQSLRSSAPFPKPAAHLLRHGRLEIAETWLFNNDGRFQLRTIAQPQMNE